MPTTGNLREGAEFSRPLRKHFFPKYLRIPEVTSSEEKEYFCFKENV
jgi:hypothetical protein